MYLFCVCALGNSGGARNCCRISKIVKFAPPGACREVVLAVVGCLKLIYFLLGFYTVVDLRGCCGSSSMKPEPHL